MGISVMRQTPQPSSQDGETPIGEGPWGKAVAKYLWKNGTRNTKHGQRDVRVGVMVTIEELRRRLPPLSESQAEEIGLIKVTRPADGSPGHGFEETHVLTRDQD